jgi:DNA topoisomerase-1
MNEVASASAVGLRYVHDTMPGIRRVKRGKNFAYIAPDGNEIRDEKELARIKSLAIPPAYTDVWICPIPNGHLQATARDARGRKQYRYHKRWREVRDETKYHRTIDFGQSLPRIRKRLEQDLAQPHLGREKVLATVVELLQTTAIRVGDEEYAKENRSYGLTTLRNHHAKVEGSTVHFSFRGKSGVYHAVDLHDPRLARIIRQTQDLPGQHLFEYVDNHGETRAVESFHVNEYIREIAGEEFSAKDFRTWLGTVTCAALLAHVTAAQTQSKRKQFLTAVIKEVAQRLGNTPAVSRKAYIHPYIIDMYMEYGRLELRRKMRNVRGLLQEERFTLALLTERAAEGEGARTTRQLQQSLRVRKKRAA